MTAQSKPGLLRLPMNVDVTWFQSRPEIHFQIVGSTHGEIVFRCETAEELLGKVVHGYAHALSQIEAMRLENKELRNRP